MNKLLLSALKYAELGFSVIPVGKDKKPYVKWEPYQKQKADKAQIEKWWERTPEAGVAIITGSISGVCVVDIDTTEGEYAFKEKIGEVHCPVAHSPRGGKHLYFQDMGCGNKTGFLPGVDFRGEGGYIIAPPSPGPNGKVYAWEQGSKITDMVLPVAPQGLLSMLDLIIGKRGDYKGGENQPSHTKSQIVTLSHNSFKQGNRDESIFHLANLLKKAGMEGEEMQSFLEVIGTKVCEPPFPEREIKEKVKSAIKRSEDRMQRITQEVREWVLVTTGHFLVTEMYKELDLVTSSHKHAAVVALTRLVTERVIERYGSKRGCYRLIDQNCEVIDYKDMSGEPLDVQLPFNLEKFMFIMPKNLLVFAGTQDAGKTALLLNIVRMNMHKHKIWYFSSEMGPMEFNSRLSLFDDISLSDWKFEALERSDNFQDVIHPDDINIIDFLEKTDNFFSIAEDFKQIYSRLNKGIAIIAIQKDPKATLGRGNTFSMEKARLYCTIDKDYPGQIIKIQKGKNWRDKFVKPAGHSLRFKIVQGCKLLAQGDWEKEGEF
jgi:hypothetical protein